MSSAAFFMNVQYPTRNIQYPRGMSALPMVIDHSMLMIGYSSDSVHLSAHVDRIEINFAGIDELDWPRECKTCAFAMPPIAIND